MVSGHSYVAYLFPCFAELCRLPWYKWDDNLEAVIYMAMAYLYINGSVGL
jgi:hypothetical protein